MQQEFPEIVVTEVPDNGDRDVILSGLMAYNDGRVGPSRQTPLAVLIKDPETGETLGGLWGRSSYDWVFVELLFVPDRYREQKLGSRLLEEAEEIGRKRGCVGVWLNTFAFQARGFYEKQGYEVFGELDEHPRGAKRFFLRKLLSGRA